MTTTIIATLSTYGFETRRADLYEVTIAHWLYDCDGDPVMDTRETRVLHGALALAWVFEEMPSSFWRR